MTMCVCRTCRGSGRQLGITCRVCCGLGIVQTASPIPTIEDHTAGFGEVEVSQKPTYDELVDFIKEVSEYFDGFMIGPKADDILERLK